MKHHFRETGFWITLFVVLIGGILTGAGTIKIHEQDRMIRFAILYQQKIELAEQRAAMFERNHQSTLAALNRTKAELRQMQAKAGIEIGKVTVLLKQAKRRESLALASTKAIAKVVTNLRREKATKQKMLTSTVGSKSPATSKM